MLTGVDRDQDPSLATTTFTIYGPRVRQCRKHMDNHLEHVRWWHSSHGTAHLELLATPSAKISSLSWTKLTRDESDRCEEVWQALTDEEKKLSQEPKSDQPVAAPVIEDGEEDLLLGVPIGKERLFEVDVKTMTVSLSIVIGACSD